MRAFLKAFLPFRCIHLVLGGKIYAIGGTDDHGPGKVDSVRCFDPSIGTRHMLLSMSMVTGRSFLSVCVLGGQLYVSHGYNDISPGHHFDSIERFDPGAGA